MVEKSGTQEAWKNFIGKFLKIILDDGGHYPVKKEGVLLNATDTHLILKVNSHSEGILIARIIRWEG